VHPKFAIHVLALDVPPQFIAFLKGRRRKIAPSHTCPEWANLARIIESCSVSNVGLRIYSGAASCISEVKATICISGGKAASCIIEVARCNIVVATKKGRITNGRHNLTP
jgi:hypothetical protein